ncbi:SAM-dependent methyltransferase [Sphaerisporangium album]|uniref:SAM-dependent methyltransferase n=1 Tax=Sphaerisporangium album TaxID=509200 RepID=UPI001FE9B98D|nr:SAM-dependent methyltransferase [Sphaerisporangium album]
MTDRERARPWVIDPTTPSVARMYDYYLGGKDNFAADREAAEKIMKLVPNAREIALANRAFLRRAVRAMVESGIDQFLDIGTGLPTQENVHQVAQRVNPDARVVYVDNDPIVLAHARALLADNRRTVVISADMRDPEGILRHEAVRAHLDFDRPVGVLLLAILHFVVDDAECARIVATLRRAVAPGSTLAISHVTSGDLTEEEVRQGRDVYTATPAGGIVPRTHAQVRSNFEGFDLLPPGVVPVEDWRPEPEAVVLPRRGGIGIVGAVGVLR